jgi:cell division protein FtsN
LADVIGSIESEEEGRAGDILDDAEFRRARAAAKRKADADEAAALAKVKAKEEEQSAAALKAKAKAAEEEQARQLAKRNPARIWVQIATGSNRAGLPGTWNRLKEKGGDAIKGKSAASAPFKSTNRLLVGPYKSQTEARAAVNKLAGKGIQATTFSSDAGEEVSPVGGR